MQINAWYGPVTVIAMEKSKLGSTRVGSVLFMRDGQGCPHKMTFEVMGREGGREATGQPLCLKQGNKCKALALGTCLGNRGVGERVVRDEGRVTEGLTGPRRDLSFHSEGDGSHCGIWGRGT